MKLYQLQKPNLTVTEDGASPLYNLILILATIHPQQVVLAHISIKIYFNHTLLTG